MSQKGFDVLLKMIQDTNVNVRELTKLTAENGLAIKLFGFVMFALFTAFLTYYFTTHGGK